MPKKKAHALVRMPLALTLAWLPWLGVLHASFSHAQLRRLRVDRWSPVRYALDDAGHVYAQRADAFIACDEQNVLHYFFHVNHTIFCCAWGISDGRCAKTLELARLRRWHRDTYGFSLAAALSDDTDAAAWARLAGGDADDVTDGGTSSYE